MLETWLRLWLATDFRLSSFGGVPELSPGKFQAPLPTLETFPGLPFPSRRAARQRQRLLSVPRCAGHSPRRHRHTVPALRRYLRGRTAATAFRATVTAPAPAWRLPAACRRPPAAFARSLQLQRGGQREGRAACFPEGDGGAGSGGNRVLWIPPACRHFPKLTQRRARRVPGESRGQREEAKVGRGFQGPAPTGLAWEVPAAPGNRPCRRNAFTAPGCERAPLPAPSGAGAAGPGAPRPAGAC